MKKELDQYLVKTFPLLYSDRFTSMQQTAMCWGFPSEGWYDLIFDLSSKLEPLIQQLIDENPDYPCRFCGAKLSEHNTSGEHKWTLKIPLRINHSFACALPDRKNHKRFKYYKVLLHYWKWLFFEKINRFLFGLNNRFNIGYNKTFKCNGYQSDHPRASQVKEKFGSLRFYMSSATNEMWDLIKEAESKSATICEECGSLGEERDDGWIRTLCDKCHQNRIKQQEELLKKYRSKSKSD